MPRPLCDMPDVETWARERGDDPKLRLVCFVTPKVAESFLEVDFT